ncbi:MAG: hypothetical protein HFE45_12185 [Oscillospiraceae bacterium]|jgi:serine protease inhibitor|nr:hypothetical protein [Oscillospiraceae bacterium]
MKYAKSVGAALCAAALLGSCGSSSDDLMKKVTPNPLAAQTAAAEADAGAAAIADFGLKLLGNCMDKGRNTLVSPLSVLCAMGMTANGANSETRAQMEAAFGMTVEELNQNLYLLAKGLPSEEKMSIWLANGLWINEACGPEVLPSFLQQNADYYGAEMRQGVFGSDTLREINGWVKKNTNGLIDKILEGPVDNYTMILVNALCFEAEWAKIYEDTQVRDGDFTTAGGKTQQVKFLYNNEYAYLSDEQAQGFYKPYAGGKYAFMALLPDEGVNLEDYAASLTGESFTKMIGQMSHEMVITAIPKFETSFSVTLNDALKAMGITDAFDERAADFSQMYNFSDLENERVWIDKVLHKTHIIVDEKGTRAGAATAVMMNSAAAPSSEEPKKVILNRPFLYALIDTTNGIPLFLGLQTDCLS